MRTFTSDGKVFDASDGVEIADIADCAFYAKGRCQVDSHECMGTCCEHFQERHVNAN